MFSLKRMLWLSLQVSHIASTEGWPVLDSSEDITCKIDSLFRMDRVEHHSKSFMICILVDIAADSRSLNVNIMLRIKLVKAVDSLFLCFYVARYLCPSR